MRSMFMRLLRSCVCACAIPWRQNACDHCKPRMSADGGSSQMLSISSLDISCMLPFSVCCFLLLLFSEKNKISCQMLNLISFTERRIVKDCLNFLPLRPHLACTTRNSEATLHFLVIMPSFFWFSTLHTNRLKDVKH